MGHLPFNQVGIGVTSIPHVTLRDQTEDIDILAMLQFVWNQKILIVATAFIFGALAAAYAFLTAPEYRVTTTLRPAAINDLDALDRTGIYSLTPDKALVRVGAALDSYDVRLGYFRANPQLFAPFRGPGQTDEQAFEDFNQKSINLVLPDAKQKLDLFSAYIGMELRYPKEAEGDEILNGLVKYAIDAGRARIAADLKVIVHNRLNEVEVKLSTARAAYDATKESQIAKLLEEDKLKKAQLQDELKALRAQLRTRRADRIAQLDEAISIARSLGIKKPSTPSSMAREGEIAGNVIRTEVNNQQIPLYFLGTDALEAERKALRSRTSDDFTEPRIAQIGKELMLLKSNRRIETLLQRQNEDVFLSEIDALRGEAARLKTINVDVNNLSLVSIDQQAVEPMKPIWPKKSLLIAVGLFVGGMIGLMIAVVRYFSSLRTPLRSE